MSANISETTRRWLRLAGAAALVVSGAIHLDLYLTGYRLITTIGPLFFVQTVATIGLGRALGFHDPFATVSCRFRFRGHDHCPPDHQGLLAPSLWSLAPSYEVPERERESNW